VKRSILLATLLVACRSRQGDPEELRDVFARKSSSPVPVASGSGAPSASGAPGAAAASARPRASAAPTSSASSDEPPAVVSTRRAPVKGPCVSTAGEPLKKDPTFARRPGCRGAEIVEFGEADGTPRYACVHRPDDVERRAPLPVVLFFHGKNESPTKVARETALRNLSDDVDLTGAAEHRGYVVLAPQARRLQGHVGFDVGFVSDENADVRATDRFLELLEKRGWVDRRRIYAMGAGTGGHMAALYTMLRPERIAAYASYAGNAAPLRWTCQEAPPPAAVLYRACDAVTPCLDMEQWLRQREETLAPTMALRLGTYNQLEPSCSLDPFRCKLKSGTANHLRWPKGKERTMLEFLGRYSLDLAGP